MATVIVRATDLTVSPSLVEIEIFVREADWLGKFDQIEVWCSKDTEGGPYEELTADNWWSARVPAEATDAPAATVTGALVNINGEELQFIVNGSTTILVPVTGADPMTFAQVATLVTALGQGLIRAYVDADGLFVVETLAAGIGNRVEVVATDAATLLGLPTTDPGNVGYGKDARLSLALGTESYVFRDLLGGGAFFYKVRLRNGTTGTTGDFSQPFVSESGVGVAPSNRVLGTLQLFDGEGKPVYGREVRVSTIFTAQVIDGGLVVGSDLVKSTDRQGIVEFSLIRNQPVTVAVMGTNLVKKVTPPTDPAIGTFNLLDAAYSAEEDYFKARVPNLPYAARRTL